MIPSNGPQMFTNGLKKVENLLYEVHSERDPVKKYNKSVEYDRLLDEPAKYKLNMTRVFRKSDGTLEWVKKDAFGNEVTEDQYGNFTGYI
jgi:hypothetical protein